MAVDLDARLLALTGTGASEREFKLLLAQLAAELIIDARERYPYRWPAGVLEGYVRQQLLRALDRMQTRGVQGPPVPRRGGPPPSRRRVPGRAHNAKVSPGTPARRLTLWS